jgi:hypothetical protein
LPYVWGFGVTREHPEKYDLNEPVRFLSLLGELGIKLVNISGGSPYYNPHIQRPAIYPPRTAISLQRTLWPVADRWK